MPTPERLINSSANDGTTGSPWKHRFGDIGEFLKVKSLEIGAGTGRLLSEAFNRTRIFIEEGCSNALCGTPTHYLALLG